jgi:hypothetical protein
MAVVQYTFIHKQYTEQQINLGRVRAVPRLCELHPDIYLTTEEKARKNLSQGSRRVPFGTMKTIVGVERDCCAYLVIMTKHKFSSVISGFRRKVDEICALLGYFGTARRSHLQGSWISCLLKMGSDMLPQNITTTLRAISQHSDRRRGMYPKKTQYNNEKNFHGPGGMWTHNPSNKTASYLRRKPGGYRDGSILWIIRNSNMSVLATCLSIILKQFAHTVKSVL